MTPGKPAACKTWVANATLPTRWGQRMLLIELPHFLPQLP